MSKEFEARKKDHIRLALDSSNQASEDNGNGFERLKLDHRALTNLNFEDVDIRAKVLGQQKPTPFFVSSMTAGHSESYNINRNLCAAAHENGWMMAVGSQRRELTDDSAAKEWQEIRKEFPSLSLISNIGLAQLITSTTNQTKKLTENLGAEALIIHCNILQECIQEEGTPQFKGGLEAIDKISKEISLPIIIKECGTGFSENDFIKLQKTSVSAVDVSGYGGTHWGRIEGGRAIKEQTKQVAEAFKSWGTSTLDSLLNAEDANFNKELWVSGGLKTGLDAAKGICLGASAAGFAGALLESATISAEAVSKKMKVIEAQLKTAMICSESEFIKDLTIDKLSAN